jgi:hypothetical protein
MDESTFIGIYPLSLTSESDPHAFSSTTLARALLARRARQPKRKNRCKCFLSLKSVAQLQHARPETPR